MSRFKTFKQEQSHLAKRRKEPYNRYEIEEFITKKRKGYTRKERRVHAPSYTLLFKRNQTKYEYIEIPKQKYNKLNKAVKT